ncbi:MAG: hypothetical protein AVDCRST_MAG67-236, partial [uncultured Solirubrobacteraceae bacterium]
WNAIPTHCPCPTTTRSSTSSATPTASTGQSRRISTTAWRTSATPT